MIRIDAAGHALHRHHGLLQQHQLGPQAHVEQGGDLEQLAEDAAHRHLLGGMAEDRLAHRPDRLGEGLHRVVRGHIAGLEVHPGDPLVVALQEAPQDLGQVAPFGRAEAADDAVIDRHQPVGGGGEQVALVQIGVEHPVVQRLGQEGPGQLGGQGRPIEPLLGEGGRIGQGHPLGPGQGQHPLAHPVPDHFGRAHVGIAGHHLAEFAGAGGLQPQVQLQLQRARHGGHRRARLQPAGLRAHLLGEARRQGHGADVGADAVLHPRAQNLDRHLAPVVQARRMGLGEGRGRHRRVELAEQGPGRPAQRVAHLGVGDLHGEGRQLVLQPGQVVGEHLAEDVGAGREQLAKLDRHGAERLQGDGQAFARPAPAPLRPGEQAQDLGQQAAGRGQIGVERLGYEGVGPHQHPQGPQEPEERGEVAHGRYTAQPWCRAATPPVKLV